MGPGPSKTTETGLQAQGCPRNTFVNIRFQGNSWTQFSCGTSTARPGRLPAPRRRPEPVIPFSTEIELPRAHLGPPSRLAPSQQPREEEGATSTFSTFVSCRLVSLPASQVFPNTEVIAMALCLHGFGGFWESQLYPPSAKGHTYTHPR